MRILYDDRELIEQLRAEIAANRARDKVLSNALESLRTSFQALAAKVLELPKPKHPEPPSRLQIAQQLGVSVEQLDEIDLGRLGITLQEPRKVGQR